MLKGVLSVLIVWPFYLALVSMGPLWQNPYIVSFLAGVVSFSVFMYQEMGDLDGP